MSKIASKQQIHSRDEIASATRGRAARTFALSLIKNPTRVGAPVPSSQNLAEFITSEIGPEDAPVLELGAGTGSFSYALLDRGVPESRLVLVDYGSDFARLLQLRFPEARVLWCDASKLQQVPNLPLFGAVISGLPLTIIPDDTFCMVLNRAFNVMRPGGRFYQFTYARRNPFAPNVLEALRLTATNIGTCWKNFPPASVYRLQRT
jgi:phospholipid N-methyltransferase